MMKIGDIKRLTNRGTYQLELNTGGTPHTDSEIDRVRDLLSREN